jgi:REP element-mobilizing transposase RayT
MKRRHENLDDASRPIFVTTTIVEWIPVFAEPGLAEDSLVLLEKIRRETGLSLIAFVLMPTHFHGIVLAAQRNNLSKFMLRWKSLSARLILKYALKYKPHWIGQFKQSADENKLAGKQDHKVWITRFDAVLLEDENQLHAAMNYIHFNPVREFLVREPGDYPHSSMRDYQGGRNGIVQISRYVSNRGQGKP